MNISKPVRIPFRFVSLSNTQSTSPTATVQELDLIPANMGSRLADLSVDFQKYRFTSLRVTAHANFYPTGSTQATSSLLQAIAWDPNPSAYTATVSGFADMADLVSYACGRGEKIMLNLGERELLSHQPTKWFDTTATGTPNDALRYQGAFYYVNLIPAANTDFLAHYQYEGVCEFAVPVDPADALALSRRLERDQRRLERLAAQETKEDSDSCVDVASPAPSVSRPPPSVVSRPPRQVASTRNGTPRPR